VEVKPRPSRWATSDEIAAAEQAFPRDVPDEKHVIRIMAETGLSRQTSKLALAIIRGDSEGDEIVVDESH
jgi:hypothetical protein